MEIDDPKTTIIHAKIIKRKKFFYNLYLALYKELISYKSNLVDSESIELGSGGGFFKEIYPEIITSDVIKIPRIDKCFPAEKIPFKDNTLSNIYILNSFHHFKKPVKFFKEALRCLKKGGRIIIIDPFPSLFSYSCC